MIQPDEDIEQRRRFVRKVARAIARGDRALADDLEQDAMMVALTAAPKDPLAWRSWLRSVTRNTLRYHRFRLTQTPLIRELPSEAEEPSSPSTIDPRAAAERAELRGVLGDLLNRLDPMYREVVYLRTVQELSARDVGRRLGISPELVRTRHRRGLAQLREGAERTIGDDWRTDRPSERRGLLAIMFAAWRPWQRVAAAGFVVPLIAGAAYLVLRTPIAPQVEGVAPLSPSPIAALEPAEEAVRDPRFAESAAGARSIAAGMASAAGAAAAADVGRALAFEVVDTSGALVPGAEIFSQVGLDGPVELVGRTNDSGRLSATIRPAGLWLAARGKAGHLSHSIYADQPCVPGADGKLRFLLNEIPVLWRPIAVHDELTDAGVTVRGLRPNPRGYTVYGTGQGIVRESAWVPAWQDGLGRYGIRDDHNIMFQAADQEGRCLWASDLHRRGEPLPRALATAPSFRLVGRLLDEQQRPVPDCLIKALLADRGLASVAEGRTDADGRFAFDDCPGTALTLLGPSGPLAEIEAQLGGEEFDVGDLRLRTAQLELRLSTARRPWRVKALHRASTSMPETLRAIGGRVLAESEVEAGAESVTLSHVVPNLVGAVLFESGEGEDQAMALVVRPEEGWGERPLYASLQDRAVGFAEAQMDPARLPAAGRWIEARSGLCLAADVDQATGEIRSGPLPAGVWTLHLLDRHGFQQTSEERQIRPGEMESFGRVEGGSASMRVELPRAAFAGAAAPGGRQLVTLRMASLCGSTMHFAHIHPDEPLPQHIDLTLPALEYTATLMVGDLACVAYCQAEVNRVQVVRPSPNAFIARLTGINAELRRDPGMTLSVVDAEGKPHGVRTDLAARLSARGEIEVLMPRIDGAQLVLSWSTGKARHACPIRVTEEGFQRVDL